MRCKFVKSVECDVFDDTVDCWYENKLYCDNAKNNRFKKRAMKSVAEHLK